MRYAFALLVAGDGLQSCDSNPVPHLHEFAQLLFGNGGKGTY